MSPQHVFSRFERLPAEQKLIGCMIYRKERLVCWMHSLLLCYLILDQIAKAIRLYPA